MKRRIEVRVPASAIVSANDRAHWASTVERTKQLRTLGWLAGRRDVEPVPDGVRVRIDVDVVKGRGSHYDPANLYPSVKAIVDGLRDAGVLVDDDWKRVDGPHLHHGGIDPALKGRAPHRGHVRFVMILDEIGGAS